MADDPSSHLKPAEAPPPDASVPSPELQRLWFALERRPWAFLTIVPAQPGAPALDAAHAILEAGSPYPQQVHLEDATGITPAEAPRLVMALRERIARGERVVAVIDSLLTHPASIPLALAADCCLLCVTLGVTDFGSARKTLELVGKDRFVGSVTFPRKKKRRASARKKKP